MLTTFVLIVHTLLTLALVAVILLQKSEGGGLGIGGGTGGGLVSARGAADLMTRSTSILAAAFIATSLLLAILYGREGETRRIDAATTAPAIPTAPLTPAAPAPAPGAPLSAPFADPAASAPADGPVPLAQ